VSQGDNETSINTKTWDSSKMWSFLNCRARAISTPPRTFSQWRLWKVLSSGI
jgi:hypothetical protein